MTIPCQAPDKKHPIMSSGMTYKIILNHTTSFIFASILRIIDWLIDLLDRVLPRIGNI